MNENIKLFLEKVQEDPDLQAKITQIRDQDEAYALASSIQPGFTKEEFITEMTRIKESVDENLTDEDLAASAGGSQEALTIFSAVTISAEVVSWGAAVAAG